eukprot:5123471-Amphidinium_carterae.1
MRQSSARFWLCCNTPVGSSTLGPIALLSSRDGGKGGRAVSRGTGSMLMRGPTCHMHKIKAHANEPADPRKWLDWIGNNLADR